MFDTHDFNCWDEAEEKAMAAFELYEQGEMDMALEHLERAIEINPDNGAWHFNAGLTLDAMNRFDEAICSYKEALRYNPDDPEILNSLAVDYTRIGYYDLALETFEHIQALEPTFEPCYCNRIITYTEIERHDLAEEMFYLSQQLNPDCPICFYNIGNSLFSRREYKRAIWCWERTAMLEPTHPQINYRIAQAYWADSQLRLARSHFLDELRINPGDTDVILDFGMFLLECGEIELAKEKFNRILELKPDSPLARFYLGEVALSQQNHTVAEHFYKDALKYNPGLPGPRYRLALISLDKGFTDKAKSFLQAEAQIHIDDSDVLLSMGKLLLQLGDNDYSTDCFLRVVDENPTNAEAFYMLGSSLATRQDYHGALQFYEHSLNLDIEKPEILIEIANLYVKEEDYATAIERFRQAYAIYSDKKILYKIAYLRLLSVLQKIQSVYYYHVKYKFALLLGKCKTQLNYLLRKKRS